VNNGYRKVLTLFTLVILVLGLMPGRVAGQAISGDIVGTVVDRTGAAVPGASIEVVNVATGVKTSMTSRDQGIFGSATCLLARTRSGSVRAVSQRPL